MQFPCLTPEKSTIRPSQPFFSFFGRLQLLLSDSVSKMFTRTNPTVLCSQPHLTHGRMHKHLSGSVRWANMLFIGLDLALSVCPSPLTSDRIYPKSKSLRVNDCLARDHVCTWWRYRSVQFNERTIYRKTTNQQKGRTYSLARLLPGLVSVPMRLCICVCVLFWLSLASSGVCFLM